MVGCDGCFYDKLLHCHGSIHHLISAFCTRELTLPDMGMIHGRLIVTAWDCGLDDVEDNTVKILKFALEVIDF